VTRPLENKAVEVMIRGHHTSPLRSAVPFIYVNERTVRSQHAKTRSPSVAEIADRTALKSLEWQFGSPRLV